MWVLLNRKAYNSRSAKTHIICDRIRENVHIVHTIPLSSLKFRPCVPFPVVFIDIQILKIGCVNNSMNVFPNPVT